MTTHAGAVAFCLKDDQMLYLIVSSSDGAHWVLPKGHIEAHETDRVAALRELVEEAGVTGEIVQGLPIQHFEKTEETVTVQYYLIRKTGTTVEHEGRSIRWVTEHDAMRLLSFGDAREILQHAVKAVQRLETRP